MDTSIVTAFVNALNSKFENKQSNKKNDITGDFSSDTASYPTVQAVKTWVGTQMSNASNLILGETSSTAYRGDRGKTAYDHSQLTSGNPHNVTKSDVGLSNVTNVAQASSTHGHGIIQNSGTIDPNNMTSDVLKYIPGIVTPNTNNGNNALRMSNNIDAGVLRDPNAYNNINTDANTNQTTINGKINMILGDIDDTLASKASSSDLTAKEDTSNKKSSWSNPTTDTNYPTEKLVKDSLDNKVDKVSGKGLSTNDFTGTYKTALDNLSTNLSAKNVTVEIKVFTTNKKVFIWLKTLRIPFNHSQIINNHFQTYQS